MLNQTHQKKYEKAGYVYILSNPYIPNLIKIGETDDIEHRKLELHSTAAPTSFVVEFYVYVDDCQALEKQLHNKFTAEHVQGKCNFYELSIQSAVAEIISLHPNADIFNRIENQAEKIIN